MLKLTKKALLYGWILKTKISVSKHKSKVDINSFFAMINKKYVSYFESYNLNIK